MANEEHIGIINQGLEVWEKWRRINSKVVPDLMNAVLSGANLNEINLDHANLKGANLRGASLRRASLREANLRGANLGHSYLGEANLCGADLRGTNIGQAINLREANLSGTNMFGANLEEIFLSNVILAGADLRFSNFRQADIRDSVFTGATLHHSCLVGVMLAGTNLSRTDFLEADLRRANLRGANLEYAKLWRADLSGADLTGANLRGADLSGADLQQAVMIGADVTEAIIDSCRVYGISTWDLKGIPKRQQDLIITPNSLPSITVDDIEVAQFIYLLLEHNKLRNVINSVSRQGVLILGRFSDGGIEVLQAIAQRLRKSKYLPIIFDFDRPDDRDYTETVKTLVGLSRFVIVDLSGPSVPQELYATVPHFKVPFIPIVEAGRTPYSMVVDLFEFPWFIKPVVEFRNKEELIELMPLRVISPAEDRYRDRQKLLEQLFS